MPRVSGVIRGGHRGHLYDYGPLVRDQEELVRGFIGTEVAPILQQAKIGAEIGITNQPERIDRRD